MPRIRNPYAGKPGFRCFGCSPDNPLGLHMEFSLEGDTVVSTWSPQAHLQGYSGVLHGGIQATLMDEIASWAIQVMGRSSGVTSELTVRYLKPVPVDHGPLRLEARLVETRHHLTTVGVTLRGDDGTPLSEATVRYFVYPAAAAARKLTYPGPDAFLASEPTV